MDLSSPLYMVIGAGLIVGGRAGLRAALAFKFRRDLDALNRGDYRPILSGYADDAVIVFNDGDHRWAGRHQGKEALERFFANFVGAGLRGEVRALHMSGFPWRLTLLVRFDDRAVRGGQELYRNRTVLLVRTRWGRVVEQEDFYEDTARITALEYRLRELGVEAVA